MVQTIGPFRILKTPDPNYFRVTGLNRTPKNFKGKKHGKGPLQRAKLWCREENLRLQGSHQVGQQEHHFLQLALEYGRETGVNTTHLADLLKPANELLQNALDDLRAGADLDRYRPTVHASAARYYEEGENDKNLLGTSLRDRRLCCDVIQETLGPFFLDELDFATIELWHDPNKKSDEITVPRLRGDALYRNKILNTLATIYKRAGSVWNTVPKGWNPCEEIKRSPVIKKRPTTWNPAILAESLDFLEHLAIQPGPLQAPRRNIEALLFVVIGCSTGLRSSEIYGSVGSIQDDRPHTPSLRWEHIDWEDRRIEIPIDVATKVSGGRFRTFYFTPRENSGYPQEICDALWGRFCHYLQPYRQESGPIFTTPAEPQRRASSQLRKAGILTGEPPRKWPKNGLRHGIISAMLCLGVDIAWVARQSGNSEKVIEDNYDDKALREAEARALLGMD
ncbi:MAG: site-specific integrase [Verrucomicrobiota bacterium]